MSTHAFLSPSASHRWLACPPSAKLCAKAADQSSEYAKQGTDAHSLCAYLIEKELGRDVSDPTKDLGYYDQEMQQCAEGYADFVMEEYAKVRQSCGDAEVMIEQKVDFSRWVKGGTGTADCIILSDGTAEVIDFKYGLGIMVSADSEEHGGNPQLMCYCLGVLEMFDGIYDIDILKITAMTALLGKKKFEELLGGMVYKPSGKPTLVSKSDKRPVLKNTAQTDFKE